MFRMFAATLFFALFFSMPVMAQTEKYVKKTSNPNHKGYYEGVTEVKYLGDKKTSKRHFIEQMKWIDLKTGCKPCETLVNEYNSVVFNLFRARKNLRFIEFNLTPEGQKEFEKTLPHFGDAKLSDAEIAIKIGAILEFSDVNKQLLPEMKKMVSYYEALEKDLKNLIKKCEKQCSKEETKDKDPISKEPKVLILPYDWKGPYTTDCFKCKKLADYLNTYPDRTYPLLSEKMVLEGNIKRLELKIKMQRMSAISGFYDGDIEDIEKEISVYKGKLDKLDKELDKIERGFQVDSEAFEKCQKSNECKPKVKEGKKKSCAPFKNSGKSISVGKNSEVGSGAAIKDKAKSQAKGAAFGALNSVLGGSGIKLGGGGSKNSKGPKTKKDPTSGEFKKLSSKGAGIEHIANIDASARFSLIGNDKLVASVKLNDVPGNGTFHAMWLEDGHGNITLPREYMIFSLYQDWKMTVWWTYDRYVDGQLVEHDEGEEVSFGRNDLGKFALWYEGAKNAIWSKLGFGTAVKGVKHIGAVFPVSKEMLSKPCPQRLVTHVSLPKKDPVVTQALIVSVPDFEGLSVQPVKAKTKKKPSHKNRQLND